MSWSQGDDAALDRLMPVVYDELRRIAGRLMRRQSGEHTYQTTDLIHEAYLKLVDNSQKEWQNRAHFFGVASRAMRHILVDYARSKNSQKRGGSARSVTLDETAIMATGVSGEIVALDGALETLEKLDARKVQVVEMKFFGGLTTDEIAKVLKMSPETVKRDWRFARTWLRRELAN
jgi:RNA polymerase sigma factor (TIGR02999 family)